jgi:hypothetical protein
MARKAGFDRITAYNRAVLESLRGISPEHADALNSYGTTLGWWHDVTYGRTSGRTPAEVANRLARNTLPGREG